MDMERRILFGGPTARRADITHPGTGQAQRIARRVASEIPDGATLFILSVSQEYLALEDGPPIFRQDTTCPALLFEFTACAFWCTGL